ncbi:MAG TPA: hypothetical protein VFY46_07290 [Acidimicrobiia bacterium]|nr:hypothetical protein [Acidimicrobiia bacterium]
MPAGQAFIVAAVILIVVAVVLNRRRQALRAELGIEAPEKKRKSVVAAPQVAIEIDHARPVVADFKIDGETAVVRFDVPYPTGGDEVLAELLMGEAIEVVRERRHHLPMPSLTQVVALAGRGETIEVGRTRLDTPGQLPPKLDRMSILNLSVLGRDPLQQSFSDEAAPETAPSTMGRERRDELKPLIDELRLPKAIDTGLRAQGVDPASASAGELVTGVLKLFGYQVSPAGMSGWVANKGGERTYIVEDRYKPGDHPELDDSVIRRFMVEFSATGASRGLLVSEKYGPFDVYTLERREPRVRFITRERIQKLIDSMAIS